MEPILNTYFQTYQNVITLSSIPKGPLADYVITIQPPALSYFQKPSLSGYRNALECIYVVTKAPVKESGITSTSWTKCPDVLMEPSDVPELFSFLTTHGYTIDTQLSRLIQDSPIDIGNSQRKNLQGGRKFLCFFHGH